MQIFFITDLCIALRCRGKNNIRGQTRKDFFIACTAWIENKIFVSKKAGGLLTEKLKAALNDTVSSFVEDAAKETVRSYETQIEERKKNDVEDTIRDHLRGFARTIPSFLMAYGTEDTTLASFDQIVPDEVFQEVTSITLEQFRFLRDGGDYKDTATGEAKHFDGSCLMKSYSMIPSKSSCG